MTRNSLTEAPPKPSKVEEIKTASRQLRGTLQEELARDSDQFGPEDIQLLKFHGTYQQYDRDTATTRKKEGLEKEFSFMLRLRLPGGKLTAAQYLALDNLADKYANGTLRITTRQTIQFHGILKRDLRATIREVNEAVITSFGACGDVVRNVTTNPAPIADYAHRRMDEDAALLSTHLLPRTRAYHDIWIDGEKQETPAAPVDEPLYGEVYLPRKFKIGIATPDDNTVDVLTNDLAVIPLFRDNTLEGYNIAIGGGLGTTHNKPETYPRLATPVAFVGPDDLLGIAEAVIALQRDHGDRSNRRHARLKYTIDDHGLAWVKERLASYFGRALEEPRPMARFRVRDHMGWHEQGDGHWYLGLHVPNGRIADKPGWRLKTALARLFATRELRPHFLHHPGFSYRRYPGRQAPGDRGFPRRFRGDARRYPLADAARGHGVPGTPHLRPGADRGGAHPARSDEHAGGADGQAWHRRRAYFGPRHRMPQRMRAALCGRYRLRRPHARSLRHLRRRRLRGHAPQYQVVRKGLDRIDLPGLRPSVRPVCA